MSSRRQRSKSPAKRRKSPAKRSKSPARRTRSKSPAKRPVSKSPSRLNAMVPCQPGKKARGGSRCYDADSDLAKRLTNPVSCQYPTGCKKSKRSPSPKPKAKAGKKASPKQSPKVKSLMALLKQYQQNEGTPTPVIQRYEPAAPSSVPAAPSSIPAPPPPPPSKALREKNGIRYKATDPCQRKDSDAGKAILYRRNTYGVPAEDCDAYSTPKVLPAGPVVRKGKRLNAQSPCYDLSDARAMYLEDNGKGEDCYVNIPKFSGQKLNLKSLANNGVRLKGSNNPCYFKNSENGIEIEKRGKNGEAVEDCYSGNFLDELKKRRESFENPSKFQTFAAGRIGGSSSLKGIKQKGQTSICYARDSENAKNLLNLKNILNYDIEDCDL